MHEQNEQQPAKQPHKQHNPYLVAIKKEQDDLVVSYMPALRAMAYRLKERLPASVDVNDLISIGIEEMIKLSRRYDKSQNDSFWGFAKKRVNGSMLDFLRSLDVMSRQNRKIIKEIEQEIGKYFQEHACEPDDKYLADKLDLSLEKIQEVRLAHSISYVLPLDEQINCFVPEDTFERVEKEQLVDKIQEVLKGCKERDKLIIQLYYFEELNLREIADILQISESRICQLHKRLLAKIRESVLNG